MSKQKPPLDLKKANIHRPSGLIGRGRFELRDGAKTVAKSDHATASDLSIQGSAQEIVAKARQLGRKVRLKGGLVIDPAESEDDEEHGELIRWWGKK